MRTLSCEDRGANPRASTINVYGLKAIKFLETVLVILSYGSYTLIMGANRIDSRWTGCGEHGKKRPQISSKLINANFIASNDNDFAPMKMAA